MCAIGRMNAIFKYKMSLYLKKDIFDLGRDNVWMQNFALNVIRSSALEQGSIQRKTDNGIRQREV